MAVRACEKSVLIFASIVGLSAEKPWMFPLTILLLPVGLAFVLVAAVAYPIAMVAGLGVWREQGIYAFASSDGVELRSISGSVQRVLPWEAVQQVRSVFTPPFYTYEAILHSVEAVRIDFLGEQTFKTALKDKGVAFLKRSKS